MAPCFSGAFMQSTLARPCVTSRTIGKHEVIIILNVLYDWRILHCLLSYGKRQYGIREKKIDPLKLMRQKLYKSSIRMQTSKVSSFFSSTKSQNIIHAAKIVHPFYVIRTIHLSNEILSFIFSLIFT